MLRDRTHICPKRYIHQHDLFAWRCHCKPEIVETDGSIVVFHNDDRETPWIEMNNILDFRFIGNDSCVQN